MEVYYKRSSGGPTEIYNINYGSVHQCNVDVAFVATSGYWYDDLGTLHVAGSVFSSWIADQISPLGPSMGLSNI